jgi:hypothetical protein
MLYICLSDKESYDNYRINGKGRISNASITVSLTARTYSSDVDWTGFGSFYLSFRIPFNQSNFAIPDNSNSEEFRYSNGEYNIKDSNPTIHFSEFSKVN